MRCTVAMLFAHILLCEEDVCYFCYARYNITHAKVLTVEQVLRSVTFGLDLYGMFSS